MKSRLQVPLLIGMPVLLLALVAWFAFGATGPSDLENAERACENDVAPEIVSTGDGGDTLTVTRAGSAENASAAALCVLDELDVPDSIVAKVEDTSASQGRQEDEWDAYKISWTFQPDNGLQLIVESR